MIGSNLGSWNRRSALKAFCCLSKLHYLVSENARVYNHEARPFYILISGPSYVRECMYIAPSFNLTYTVYVKSVELYQAIVFSTGYRDTTFVTNSVQ